MTGRAIVLGALVVLLLVVLASPLNHYFHSRSRLQAAAAQLHHDQRQLHELTRQYKQWSDPGFVAQQARERLQYAMPGDTVYVVVDRGASSRIERSAPTTSAPPAPTSWNQRLWGSVQAAAR